MLCTRVRQRACIKFDCIRQRLVQTQCRDHNGREESKVDLRRMWQHKLCAAPRNGAVPDPDFATPDRAMHQNTSCTVICSRLQRSNAEAVFVAPEPTNSPPATTGRVSFFEVVNAAFTR